MVVVLVLCCGAETGADWVVLVFVLLLLLLLSGTAGVGPLLGARLWGARVVNASLSSLGDTGAWEGSRVVATTVGAMDGRQDGARVVGALETGAAVCGTACLSSASTGTGTSVSLSRPPCNPRGRC